MNGTRPLALLVLVCLLVMAAGSTAFAKTINVPANYKTIQKAIDAAVNGDVVVVAPGTYTESIDFKGKAITVESTNPTDKTVVAATIIDGQKDGSVVIFKSGEKATSVLTGLTITNGSGYCYSWPDLGCYGGGVYCSGSSPTLTNNIIRGNSVMGAAAEDPDESAGSGCGGGVACENGSSPTLINNTVSGNSATGGSGGSWGGPGLGGGVHCGKGSSPHLTNNTISGDSTDDGVDDNGFEAGGGGGGVYCWSATLTNNTISGNSAGGDFGDGGGVSCGSSSLTNNTISGNKAAGYGGGVECWGSATLTNNTISGNSGGGVSCENGASPALTNNTVSGNSAGYGGGVFCHQSSPSLTNNTISGNSATDSGGGVYCLQSSPSLTNNTLSGNKANHGGGVYCEHQSSPSIRNTIIALNGKGGGLYVDVTQEPTYPSKPVITYCDLYGNTGGDYVHWPKQTGKNGNISHNPLFANPAKGDFHERSKGGRWNPATKAWVKDTVQSPCIDAGDPKSPFSKEPKPNGGRINMGAYGNTLFASKSASAAAAGGVVLTATAASTSSGLCQITVDLTSAASVQVTILNIAGRQVAVLPPQDLPDGLSTLLWDGRSTAGTKAPTGRYLMRLTARGQDGSQAQALASLSLGR